MPDTNVSPAVSSADNAIDLAAIKKAVGAWFQTHIAVGPIAWHIPAYNQALAAKDTLLADVERLFTGERAPVGPLSQPVPVEATPGAMTGAPAPTPAVAPAPLAAPTTVTAAPASATVPVTPAA